MTRALVEGLRSPVPLGSLLPDVYRRYDENILAFTAALDEVLAPVWLTLDNYDAYLDPGLAPDDFLEMLAAWVGFPIDRNWSDEQTRRLVASAVDLYRWRGTQRGLRDLVRAYTGVEPEVFDSGGTTWSAEPGAAPPGSAEPAVRIVVDLPAGSSSDLARLTRLIASSVPADVGVTVEVRRESGTTSLGLSELTPSAEPLASAGTPGGSAEVSPYGPAVEAAPEASPYDEPPLPPVTPVDPPADGEGV